MPIDVNFLRAHKGGDPAPYVSSFSARTNSSQSPIPDLIHLDSKYRAASHTASTLRSARAALQKTVTAAKKAGEEALPATLAELKAQAKAISQHDKQLKQMKASLSDLISKIPNIIDEEGLSLAGSERIGCVAQPLPLSNQLLLLLSDPTAAQSSYISAFLQQLNGFAALPEEPPLLTQQKKSWVAEKTLPCKFSQISSGGSAALSVLILTTNNLVQSRKEYCELVDLMLTLLAGLGMKCRAVPRKAAELDIYAVAEADIEIFSVDRIWVRIGRVSNFTDFHSRSEEVRAGVKKMIQINKNYCHSIHGELGMLVGGGGGGEGGNLTLPVVLHELDKFFMVNSYVSKSYEPNGEDMALLRELGGAGLRGEDYVRWKHLKRWGNAVAEINSNSTRRNK
ncbi:hypothetical protein TL16_g07124 [Triparma laevis f. inornata]|uniref:Serine-tRNA synthetase type1 N-terminal domain-containing protein n=1 Tax=Triparma laevis f. inornata TaxID=1714386 RepID=A0A9W7ARU3_9STRA|nr:hypothetical protein TL16_g07124 [Triparma laevis f. inornata]